MPKNIRPSQKDRDNVGLEKILQLARKRLQDAREEIDATSVEELKELQERYGGRHYAAPDQGAFIVEGRGSQLWDLTGRRLLDANSRYCSIAGGYRNHDILAAGIAQEYLFAGAPNNFASIPYLRLLKRICTLTGQDKAIVMNTGAESFDTAVKAARQWGYKVKKVPLGEAEVIICKNNFHGRTLCASGASSAPYQKYFGPFAPGFAQVAFNDIEVIKAAITKNTVAIIVEPIQGEGGIIIPDDDYLPQLRQTCDDNRILLIFDEVQTGLGRTGKMFACEHWAVVPDGIMLAKALGQSDDVSAFAARKEIIDLFEKGTHGSTFGGNPVACAKARASLDEITADDRWLVRNSRDVGAYLLQGLRDIGLDAHGRGLLIGIRIPQPYKSADVYAALYREGIVAGDAGHNTVRFSPALTFSKTYADLLIVRTERALQACGVLST